MFETVYTKPSFYAHLLTGLILLFVIVIIYLNYKKINISLYQKLILLLLITIIIGLHGISHLLLEIHYGFNPLEKIF